MDPICPLCSAVHQSEFLYSEPPEDDGSVTHWFQCRVCDEAYIVVEGEQESDAGS